MNISRGIREPWRMLSHHKLKWLTWLVPDGWYLKSQYRSFLNKKLDLTAPKSYNEKLQWLKIHDRQPVYTGMVDKLAAKDYVAKRIGAEYIIPVLSVHKKFEDIDFAALPDQFVLKCNHDSAGLVICTDKNSFDWVKAQKKMTRCLKRNFYYSGREWPYKNIRPCIIAEKYMEDHTLHELRDYKFFTFGGVPKIVHIVSNRQNKDEETYGDFFDMDYNHLDLTMGHNNAPVPPEKPKNFEKMKEFAAKLSEGTMHLRVDFYEVDGNLYFGELTFYQDSGFADIQPPEWDDILGSWISLE